MHEKLMKSVDLLTRKHVIYVCADTDPSKLVGCCMATFQASYIIEINMIYIDSLASCYKSQFTLNTTFA